MGKNKLLYPSLTLLLLLLLPTDASVSGKPQYMVLVPSLLHTETPEKGCLLLSHLNETVTVSASLESVRENRSLFTDVVAEKDPKAATSTPRHCWPMPLPWRVTRKGGQRY
uniref:Alpha-2-macroglobulin variant 3 n=1 Tax=Bos taurus TaxID=9913 RepID=K4JF02_BOVIN|nr:alpha-2-macroglobulin variant 3 [Bos taurus]